MYLFPDNVFSYVQVISFFKVFFLNMSKQLSSMWSICKFMQKYNKKNRDDSCPASEVCVFMLREFFLKDEKPYVPYVSR